MPHEHVRGRRAVSLGEPLEVVTMRQACQAEGLGPEETAAVMASVIAAHYQLRENDAA